MPYKNEHSCRLKDPGLFREPWVRINRKSASVGKEYDIVRGTLKSSGKVEDQSYRYKKDKWTLDEAQKHCRVHQGTFEPAESTAAHARAAMSFAQKFLNTPLLLDHRRADDIKHIYETYDFSAFGGLFSFLGDEADMKIENGIAVIPVYDALSNKERDVIFEGTSYEKIGKNFRKALGGNDVEHIGFDFRTGGGDVSGAFELAEEIYNARGIKPMTAVLNDAALSAGYLLASATDRIIMPEFGQIAGIGVLSIHADISAQDAMRGIKYTTITKGAKKASMSSHSPLSKEALKDLDDKLEVIHRKFLNTVARNRNISVESVESTEAGVLQGAEGVKAGLADEVLAWNDILQAITSNPNGGITMKTLLEQLTSLKEGGTPEEWNEAISQLGLPNAAEITKMTAQAAENLKYFTEMVNGLQAEITQLKSKPTGDAEMAARIQTLETDFKGVQTELKDAKTKLAGAQESRRVLEIKNQIDSIGVLGDVDKMARRLYSLEKIDPKLFAEEIEQLQTVSNALKSAHIFDEIGSTGLEVNVGGARDKLMTIVQEKIKSGVTEADAWRQAAKENRELYTAYREGN